MAGCAVAARMRASAVLAQSPGQRRFSGDEILQATHLLRQQHQRKSLFGVREHHHRGSVIPPTASETLRHPPRRSLFGGALDQRGKFKEPGGRPRLSCSVAISSSPSIIPTAIPSPASVDSAGSSACKEPEPPSFQRFVKSQTFALGVSAAILYGCAAVAAQVHQERRNRGGHANTYFVFTDHFITTFFVLEWCARVAVSGPNWFREPMNLLTTCATWISCVLVIWVLEPFYFRVHRGQRPPQWLRILRMLRMVRILSVFKHLKVFKDMWLLLRGLQYSMTTLASALVLIVYTVYTFGVFAADLIGNADLDPPTETQEKFRSLTSAMLTMLQVMHSDDAIEVIDELHAPLPHVWMFFIAFTAISSFVLLNLVTAIIVQQALDITRMDDEAAAEAKQLELENEMRECKEIFSNLDVDGDCLLSMDEFKLAFDDPRFKEKLRTLRLSEKQLVRLFELLDTPQHLDDGEEEDDGRLDLEEFTEGMGKIQGQATGADMLLLSKRIERILKLTHRLQAVGTEDPKVDLQEVVGLLEASSRRNIRNTSAALDATTVTLKGLSEELHEWENRRS